MRSRLGCTCTTCALAIQHCPANFPTVPLHAGEGYTSKVTVDGGPCHGTAVSARLIFCSRLTSLPRLLTTERCGEANELLCGLRCREAGRCAQGAYAVHQGAARPGGRQQGRRHHQQGSHSLDPRPVVRKYSCKHLTSPYGDVLSIFSADTLLVTSASCCDGAILSGATAIVAPTLPPAVSAAGQRGSERRQGPPHGTAHGTSVDRSGAFRPRQCAGGAPAGGHRGHPPVHRCAICLI